MILTYHRIQPLAADPITVSEARFLQQMQQIRDKKVVLLDDYDPEEEDQIVITFDDGFKDVLLYALPILRRFGYPFEIFVVDRFYRQGEAGNRDMLDRKDLQTMIEHGGRLQYHTRTHPRLDEIEEEEKLTEEILVPEDLRELDPDGFHYLAYPYWRWNEQVLREVEKHFRGARSGNGFEKENDRYALPGVRMDNETNLEKIS